MSDTPQGPGWWQASDGKWYPPEQAPGTGGGVATLETGAAIGYGWNKFVQYIGQFIVIAIIIVVVQVIFWAVGQGVGGGVGGTGGIIISLMFSALSIFVSLLLQAGLVRAALAVTRGETPEPSMLFQTQGMGPYVVGALLVALLTFIGFFVFCIGALIVMFFTLFWQYFVLDRGASAGEAISGSFNLVKNNAGTVLVFAIVVIVLNFITCGLAFGVTTIATAYAFKVLHNESVAS